MKLLDGDKLKKHLDYLIKKDTQFAKMCEGNDDFNRQRKYSFEANILAYELCQNVMDYYLVTDSQVMDQWISVNDRLPDEDDCYLVVIESEICVSIDIAEYSENRWHKHDRVLYWRPLPELPKDGETNG